mmetsp:Transcript_39513/g.63688  ORF Transcript_39513/g.63688 Transcript_39513/m.63688 type:complete len:201 (-) Transcript_39513:761-1363(-)
MEKRKPARSIASSSSAPHSLFQTMGGTTRIDSLHNEATSSDVDKRTSNSSISAYSSSSSSASSAGLASCGLVLASGAVVAVGVGAGVTSSSSLCGLGVLGSAIGGALPKDDPITRCTCIESKLASAVLLVTVVNGASWSRVWRRSSPACMPAGVRVWELEATLAAREPCSFVAVSLSVPSVVALLSLELESWEAGWESCT